MNLLAIDPGPEESALVAYATDTRKVLDSIKAANEYILNCVRLSLPAWHGASHLAVEMIASYGMPVGAETFETCVWIGRYVQAWHRGTVGSESRPFDLVDRRDVKLHLCNSPRAKDANVRQALIDRYGGKEKAIGRKATPGPLYGLTSDRWAALGVAVTVAER